MVFCYHNVGTKPNVTKIAELKDLQDDFEEKKQKLKKRGTLKLVCIKLFAGD
jgi:hypothetical protein